VSRGHLGPSRSDPIRLADERARGFRSTSPAPLEGLWAVVTDIDLPARFSDEFLVRPGTVTDLGEGLSFVGRNRQSGHREWRSSRS